MKMINELKSWVRELLAPVGSYRVKICPRSENHESFIVQKKLSEAGGLKANTWMSLSSFETLGLAREYIQASETLDKRYKRPQQGQSVDIKYYYFE